MIRTMTTGGEWTPSMVVTGLHDHNDQGCRPVAPPHRAMPAYNLYKKEKNTITPLIPISFSLYTPWNEHWKNNIFVVVLLVLRQYINVQLVIILTVLGTTLFLLFDHFIIIGRFVTLHYNISNFYRKSKNLLGFPLIFTGKSAIRFSTHLKKKKSQELPAQCAADFVRYYYIHTFHQ